MELPTPALADLDTLLSRLGGEEAVTASARAHGAFSRAREVKTAIDLLRLVLRYGPGGLSLRTARGGGGRRRAVRPLRRRLVEADPARGGLAGSAVRRADWLGRRQLGRLRGRDPRRRRQRRPGAWHGHELSAAPAMGRGAPAQRRSADHAHPGRQAAVPLV